MDMYLIVGLGNPGKQYQNTRHNAGFMYVQELYDYLSREQSAYKREREWHIDKYLTSEVAVFTKDSEKLILAKPQTFMNASGSALRLCMKRYLIDPEKELFVAHDDLDIPLGKIKLHHVTGPKLHNGLSSIQNALRTTHFFRIRIGIEARTSETHVPGLDYVLTAFSPEEQLSLRDAIILHVQQLPICTI